ncbi:MAG: DUF4386 domain-containing protein [Pyrinomonadaceae bacterium]
MRSEISVGRVVGILLLLQMASALVFPFVLIDALNRGYPAFLETAAASGVQIRAGVTLAFLGMALTLALGVWLYPVLRPHSKSAALWFLAVCAISAALDAVHNASVISMLAAGEKFAASGGADSAVYQAWGAAAASMRRSAHIVQLFTVGAWMATFYVSLWRFRLIPRPLSALGTICVASQFTGVTAMMFLGYPALGYLAIPLAPIHAATATWLIVKGFPSAEPSA